jgi:hypothetical protein
MRFSNTITGTHAQYARENPALCLCVAGSHISNMVTVTVIIQLLIREWWFKKCSSICSPKHRGITRALAPSVTEPSTYYSANVIIGDKVKLQSAILAYTLFGR